MWGRGPLLRTSAPLAGLKGQAGLGHWREEECPEVLREQHGERHGGGAGPAH